MVQSLPRIRTQVGLTRREIRARLGTGVSERQVRRARWEPDRGRDLGVIKQHYWGRGKGTMVAYRSAMGALPDGLSTLRTSRAGYD